MDNESDVPARLSGLLRRYIDGHMELDPFLAAVFPLWQNEGWGLFFDRTQMSPEQLMRADAFERRFAELNRKK